jgi:hypothetical protein
MITFLAFLMGGVASAQTDVTSKISNPSFETNGTTGWMVNSMQTQTNNVFSKKSGTTYVEAWVSIGQQLGDRSVTQTIKALPRGNYKLTAAGLHIQQSGSGSITNKGAAQTGAYIFAGTAKTEVTAMNDYSLTFSVMDEKADVEIGLRAENATGNYLCIDNFTMQYLGDITAESYVGEMTNLVERGRQLQAMGVQNGVNTLLNTAIDAATMAMQGTGTDGAGKPIYDLSELETAYAQLVTAVQRGKKSRALYDALQERIDYANKVVTWWTGVSRKANALAKLITAIETAQEKVTNYGLADTQLTSAKSSLNSSIKNVDKRIYCSTNACGTDEQLNVSTNQWCYDRSLQSKHWILFWEAGYGTGAPAAVPGILETADKIFEFYADSLKFITINQGKSKTDNYKMIIRLRHTTTWEASGSGIDDQIGLLTLSNGAHTSRSGQTVAHEIGHCFQYQVHCDNNNWNGWMYNWGSGTLNVFWEMCAQWQAYKFYPHMQFVWDSGQGNDWLMNTLNGLHRHPLCMDLRYNNYFIQDYFCHKHGMDMVGRLWNKSQSPEDPLQAYMRLTMTGTDAEKLDQLNNEMWEYGARMTTFDMDPIRSYGADAILKRTNTAVTALTNKWLEPTAANCVENFGHNAIRLNVPKEPKTVFVEIKGEAGKNGFTAYNTESAGWKYGFVALLKDNTRIYGDIGTLRGADAEGAMAFDCPANCKYLWLVVSGAPTSYWTRDWIGWSEESTAEQWPYCVKFYQTNLYGRATNNEIPTGIAGLSIQSEHPAQQHVYTLSGQLVRQGTTSTAGLPKGIYLIGGRKVMVK